MHACRCMQCCSDFLAGNMLRSKTRYAALDETAVMGCVCRHECPIPCFINLKHGERLCMVYTNIIMLLIIYFNV